MTPTLVFDLETIPDIAGLRTAWELEGDDSAVAEAAFARRRERTGGSDFLPLHLHRIVAISCVFRDAEGLRVRSLGNPEDGEDKLVQDFFKVIERYRPQLVSWNGGGFDLPVLHYRAMVHGVRAPHYWDQGELERESRFNNYLNRYHSRHTDLMDVLASYGGRANAPLDELARLCGLPGKMGMDGSQVWPAWQAGRVDEIRAYCETDVVNTWLLWCRWQHISGRLTTEQWAEEQVLSRAALAALEGGHWNAYLARWDAAATGAPR